MTNIQIEETIQGVIRKIKAHRIQNVAIVGGYMRNKYLGVPTNDVDIVIAATLDDLKGIFSRVEYTELGITFGVCRVRLNNTTLEFSLCTNDEFEDKLLNHRDFTVNTLYYLNDEVKAGSERAFEDLNNKLLVAASPPREAADRSPHYILRAMKFISNYGFELDEGLKREMLSLKDTLLHVKPGRVQREFADIIRGEYIFQALKTYKELGYIENMDKKINWFVETKLPIYSERMTPRIAYLMVILGKESVVEWLRMHCVSENTIKNAIELMPYYNDDIPIDIKKWQDILVLKRYQHDNDIEIIQRYYEEYKKATKKS